MSRSRRLRCVFAVLLGWALLTGTFQAAVPAALAAPAAVAHAPAEPGSASVAAFASAGPAGPACDPGSAGRDGVPALPVRAGPDQAHAQAPPARTGAEGVAAPRVIPVRVPVRGPGQSAPSPLELSVMRV